MFGLTKRKEWMPAILGREWSPLEMFREGADEWFDRFFEGMPAESRLGAFWRTTAEETEKEVVYRMELPGFEVKDIDVRMTDNVLTVEARTPEVKEAKVEKPMRHFRRTLTLPVGLDVAHVAACYRNGILELRFPRLAEVQGRRIEVKP